MNPRVKALLKQLHSGQLKSDISRILDHIKKHPYSTLPEIKRKLGIAHQTASARISDLLDLGLIQEHGEKKTAYGVYSYFKYQPNYDIQRHLATERKKEKFKHWVKKGLTQFEELINPKLKEQLCKK